MGTSGLARVLGRRGGKVRAARLSPAERVRIAAMGGHSRAISLHAARRIAENFRYVEAMAALRPRPKVTRLRKSAGPLPGIYASKPQKE